MIYEALIVPSELPTTLREIKRALITYDKVLLIDPSDRELFPRNAFFAAISGMPLIGLDTGAVRPMGKSLGYDERFERMLDSCRVAMSEQLLSVVSTFSPPPTGELTIGAVPLGGYPLRASGLLQFYRGLARSQELLSASVEADVSRLETELVACGGLALTGRADGSINDDPALPLARAVAQHEAAVQLTQIARARIGAILKYWCFCEAKNLVPVFNAPHYTRTLALILDRAREFLTAGDVDGAHVRRSRVLELAHEEFLVDERLDALSVEDVLKLRSVAWGQQATAREQLFEAVFQIAESSNSEQFVESVSAELREYRKASESLLRERVSLGVSIKCDLGAASLAGGVTLSGLLSQLESPLQSAAITLAAGGVWALERAKEYVPKLREIQAQTAELRRGAGVAFHDFYERLPRTA
jgi:hypothetical protein